MNENKNSNEREPHWLWWMWPTYRAIVEVCEATILSRILEMFWRRAMMGEDNEGSQDGLLDVLRRTPFAIFIEVE